MQTLCYFFVFDADGYGSEVFMLGDYFFMWTVSYFCGGLFALGGSQN